MNLYSIFTAVIALFKRLSWLIVMLLLVWCCRLQYLLAQQRQISESCQKHAEELSIALDKQNQAVKALEGESQRQTERFNSANRIAEIKNRYLSSKMDSVQNRSGKHCQDAMPMVDDLIYQIQNQY